MTDTRVQVLRCEGCDVVSSAFVSNVLASDALARTALWKDGLGMPPDLTCCGFLLIKIFKIIGTEKGSPPDGRQLT